MSKRIFALLVHDRPEPFEALKRTLKDLSVETYSIATCKEAERLISQCKPHIIFTGSSVADGSWMSILNMAETADVPLSVIVVAAVPDTRLYLSVMERGAFDFVAPPFEHESLHFVVRSAVLDANRRREMLVHAAVAQPIVLPGVMRKYGPRSTLAVLASPNPQ